jgi:hypothetical protein
VYDAREEIPLALRSRHIGIVGTLGLAVFLSGCGLSEYEANMASEQARVHRIDEENKYLDDPVEWPAKKESDKKETGKKDPDKNYVDVFFRPPRGISRKPNTRQHGTLYVFPRSGDNSGNILEIEIGTAVDQEGFANDVVKLFVPAEKLKEKEKDLMKPPLERQVPGRKEPLSFATATFEDTTIYIYKKGNMQVAVVYRLDKTKNSETTTKVQMSLESLAIGADAAQENRKFRQYHSKAPGK